MSQFSESGYESSEQADQLDALEASIEQSAGNAGLTAQDVAQLEAALEAAANGEVSPQELQSAASTMNAMASGEMTVNELAYQEQFLPFLAPIAKAAVGFLSSPAGGSIVSGIGNFLGGLFGGGGGDGGDGGEQAFESDLQALEAQIEQSAGEAGLNEQDVQQLEAALEAAVYGEVTQQELDTAAQTLDAMSTGEMTLNELAYQEQFLPLLGPAIGALTSIIGSPVGGALINGVKNLIGGLTKRRPPRARPKLRRPGARFRPLPIRVPRSGNLRPTPRPMPPIQIPPPPRPTPTPSTPGPIYYPPPGPLPTVPAPVYVPPAQPIGVPTGIVRITPQKWTSSPSGPRLVPAYGGRSRLYRISRLRPRLAR